MFPTGEQLLVGSIHRFHEEEALQICLGKAVKIKMFAQNNSSLFYVTFYHAQSRYVTFQCWPQYCLVMNNVL